MYGSCRLPNTERFWKNARNQGTMSEPPRMAGAHAVARQLFSILCEVTTPHKQPHLHNPEPPPPPNLPGAQHQSESPTLHTRRNRTTIITNYDKCRIQLLSLTPACLHAWVGPRSRNLIGSIVSPTPGSFVCCNGRNNAAQSDIPTTENYDGE